MLFGSCNKRGDKKQMKILLLVMLFFLFIQGVIIIYLLIEEECKDISVKPPTLEQPLQNSSTLALRRDPVPHILRRYNADGTVEEFNTGAGVWEYKNRWK